MAYTRNVAVIKGTKDGFSADGGKLSGIIKAERYSGNLAVEVSLINFAPLSEGRYVCALSDGPHTQIIEGGSFSGESEVNTDGGFGAVICFVNGGVQVIATAVCGSFHSALFGLKGEIERQERFKTPPAAQNGETPAAAERYEDEAIAEDNYYEYSQNYAGGELVCKGGQEEEKGHKPGADAQGLGNVADNDCGQDGNGGDVTANARAGENSDCGPADCGGDGCGFDGRGGQVNAKNAGGNGGDGGNGETDGDGGNCGTDGEGSYENAENAAPAFYLKMRAEIEGLLAAYPREERLCAAVEGSEWVKISYGEDAFYVFGVIKEGGVPRYLCYGIPSAGSSPPPASMRGLADFLPVEGDGAGFWVMYQDAETGSSIANASADATS